MFWYLPILFLLVLYNFLLLLNEKRSFGKGYLNDFYNEFSNQLSKVGNKKIFICMLLGI